ncbi:MAG TPA: hypothetical protein VIL49_08600 [Capillimicrobium sp.]
MRPAVDVQIDRDARGAGRFEQALDVGQARRGHQRQRLGLLAQHAERPPRLAERFGGQAVDPLEGAAGQRVARHAPGPAGLQRDRAQVMARDVVHVAHDPQPLLRHGALHVLVAQLLDPPCQLPRFDRVHAFGPQPVAEERGGHADRQPADGVEGVGAVAGDHGDDRQHDRRAGTQDARVAFTAGGQRDEGEGDEDRPGHRVPGQEAGERDGQGRQSGRDRDAAAHRDRRTRRHGQHHHDRVEAAVVVPVLGVEDRQQEQADRGGDRRPHHVDGRRPVGPPEHRPSVGGRRRSPPPPKGAGRTRLGCAAGRVLRS